MDMVTRAIVMGVIATAAMDIWALALNRFAGIGLPNWGFVGRWFAHLPRGSFVHADIGASEPVTNEAAIGWAAHYIIGIASLLFLTVVAFAMCAVFTLLTSATGSANLLTDHSTLSASIFLLFALAVFGLAMAYDISDPRRQSRQSA